MKRMKLRTNTEKFDWNYFIRHIAIIAVPVAMQNLLTTTGSMVDTMMLASLGEKTVGAVGLCAQFSSLMFAGYWGFVGGGMLFFAQYWGAKNDDGITRSFGITLSFMMTVGIVFSFLALGAPGFIMNIYTDKPEIQQIGISYLRIVGFAYILQVLAMAVSALLRSIEQVKIPLYGGMASVAANCFFNYLLIFGKFGFPKMGVRGAALGTVLAGGVNLLILLFFILKNRIPYVLEFSKHFRWNRKFVQQYLQKCFPIICNEVMIGVGNMMINIVLGHQSEKAIAAVAVFRTLEGLVIAFFSGFSNAATVLVGKEVGAGNHEIAFQRAKRLVYMCSALIGTVYLVVFMVHNPLLHAMGLSGESYRIGTGMMILYGIAALIRMGNWVQNDAYRSAGDAAFGSIMEITFMYLMVLPCVYLSNYVFHAPFLVVFALCYVDEPIRYIIMQCHMYSGKWLKPVSDEGVKTIGEFRQNHGISVKNNCGLAVEKPQ
ncbi:MATE family efflux transporter [Parablautia muri]|uniref:Probable multidrug resistance protein NorM n=1 Tax=Parablautia muri TaxID=2320879 RepID=A0A9X5BF82_9FIRM|nr:MATE family efflux transporter [Parablautia muri]NBJ92820.1 MATE family efflux transporter [Parablautia muri]